MGVEEEIEEAEEVEEIVEEEEEVVKIRWTKAKDRVIWEIKQAFREIEVEIRLHSGDRMLSLIVAEEILCRQELVTSQTKVRRSGERVTNPLMLFGDRIEIIERRVSRVEEIILKNLNGVRRLTNQIKLSSQVNQAKQVNQSGVNLTHHNLLTNNQNLQEANQKLCGGIGRISH